MATGSRVCGHGLWPRLNASPCVWHTGQLQVCGLQHCVSAGIYVYLFIWGGWHQHPIPFSAEHAAQVQWLWGCQSNHMRLCESVNIWHLLFRSLLLLTYLRTTSSLRSTVSSRPTSSWLSVVTEARFNIVRCYCSDVYYITYGASQFVVLLSLLFFYASWNGITVLIANNWLQCCHS